MKTNILKLTLIILFLALIPAVTAAEFDNIKQVPDNFRQREDTITIRNSIGRVVPLDKIADVRLIENTDQALINGMAMFEIKLYEDYLNPIKELRYVDDYGIDRESLIIESEWTVYDNSTYDVRVDDSYNNCTNLNDANNTEVCEIIRNGSHQEQRQHNIWRVYNSTKTYEIGTYYIKIEAKKPVNRDIDFIPKLFNVELDEFAWWNNSWLNRRVYFINETLDVNRNRTEAWIDTIHGLNNTNCTNEIRILDSTETNEIPSYAKHINDTACEIFFVNKKLDTESFKKYYIYYNNPAATDPVYVTNLSRNSTNTIFNQHYNITYNTAFGSTHTQEWIYGC